MLLITGIDGYVNHPPSELMKKQFHFLSHSERGHWWSHSPDTRYHCFKWPVWKIRDRELWRCHLDGPWEELGALPSEEQELVPEADCNFCTGKPHSLCVSTGYREKRLEQTEAVYQEKICCYTWCLLHIGTTQQSLESWAVSKHHAGFYGRFINSVYFSQLFR